MLALRHLSPLRVALAITALLAVALALAVRLQAPDIGGIGRLVGRTAPEFALPAERDGALLPGQARLSALRGEPVLAIFLYSLCSHCGTAARAVKTVASEELAGAGAIYVDSPAEALSIADVYARRLGLDAPLLLDAGGRVAASYGVASYPVTLLIDGAGVVRAAWTGEVSSATLRAAVNRSA
jgi:peroxiredoxin